MLSPNGETHVILDEMTDGVRLQQRPDEPQRQQPSAAKRRDAEPLAQASEPDQADRPDRRRGRRAREREQRAHQGVLQHAREYRSELRNTLGVAADRIGNADPSRAKSGKDEEEDPQDRQDVGFRLWLRPSDVRLVQPGRSADGMYHRRQPGQRSRVRTMMQTPTQDKPPQQVGAPAGGENQGRLNRPVARQNIERSVASASKPRAMKGGVDERYSGGSAGRLPR